MDLATLKTWLALQGPGGWITQVFLVVLAALTADFVQRRVLARLRRKLETTQNPWDDAVVDALARPLSLLIWVVGIAFAAQIAERVSQAPIFAAVGPMRDVGVIVAVTWFLIRVARRIEQNVVRLAEDRGHGADRHTVDAVSRLVRVSIFITAVLVAMQTLGYSVSGVLAFGGIGGVNEKIEGFFDLCQARGLTGKQGVMIPESNVKHLMLRHDIIAAVARGEFAIYPIATIDQGIEVLTGQPAGERDADGNFPADSVNGRVEARLHELARARKQFGAAARDDKTSGEADKQGPPPAPPTPPTPPPTPPTPEPDDGS